MFINPQFVRNRRLSAKKAMRGMTLIEIMVVVAIISLILGGVGVVAFGRLAEARLQDARNKTIQIQQNVELFRTQKRRCPKNIEELKTSGIAARIGKDPWGHDYVIKCPGEQTTVDVICAGPDGEVGTDDDITNYEDEKELEEDDGK